jgi:hypothetical protein
MGRQEMIHCAPPTSPDEFSWLIFWERCIRFHGAEPFTQLVKKFPAFYGIPRFIMLIRAQQWSLIPNQMNPLHCQPYFSKINSNIILPLAPKSSELSPPFRFSDQNILCPSRLSRACYVPRPSHPPSLDHPNNIWWNEQVMKLRIM